MRKELIFSFCIALVLHAGVLVGFALRGMAPSNKVEKPKQNVEWIAAEEPLPPIDPPKDVEEEKPDVAAAEESPAASLPEVPQAVALDTAITMISKPTPPTPPRPDALARSLIPTERAGGPREGGGAGRNIPNVFSVLQLDRIPEARVRTPAQYPRELMRQALTGTVTVRFFVDETGSVENVEVLSSSHPEFARSAVDAVRRWKFRPGTKDGRPVKFFVEQPIAFRLDGQG